MAGYRSSLEQQQTQTQTLRLTHQQLMLLKLLEVPTIELEDKIKQEIEENPALEELSDGTSDRIDENDEDYTKDEYDDDYSESKDDYDDDDYEDRYDIKDSDIADFDERAEDYLMSRQSSDDDRNYTEFNYGETESMLDNLIEQLDFLKGIDPKIARYAKYVLGNLDSYGFLQRNVEQLSDDFSFASGEDVKDEDMAKAVEIVQSLEPAGVGARDLRECLLLQLKRKENKDRSVSIAIRALENCFDDVSIRRLDRIASKLNVSADEIKDAFSVIASLNPRPYTDNDILQDHAVHIVPDFEVHADDNGQLVLTVLKGRIPELGISRTYQEMIATYTKGNKKTLTQSQKDAAAFARQKVENAEWFIRAIKQRADTLYEVVSRIVMYQRRYFLTGDSSQLRPMTLKDVAGLSKFEVSTISRVTNGKYIQTDFGVFALKDLFTESVTNGDGDDISTTYIKDMIKKAVDEEDKKSPLTDEQLVAIIAEKGANVARRTIAKYRDQLGIPSTRSRREVL